MTIVLNSVAAGMIGGPKVLAFPRQEVSIPFSNYYNQCHNRNNNNNCIRFSSGLSTIRSRSVTVLSSTSNQLSYRSWYTYNCLEEEKDCNRSTRLEEEEEDYNDSNNGRTRPLSYDRMDGSSSSRSCSCNFNNNDENNSIANTSPSSYDRMGGLSSSSRSCSCNYNNNENNSIANTSPSSYDRMGGSSSSLSLSSSNFQNSSPSIQINIVFPSAASTIAMLSHVYSKVYPLLDQLMLFVQDKSLFFFQVAVSDKERALLRKLNKISENANTSTSDGLNCVFKEVIKALLQYNDSSIHFTMLNTYYGSWKSLSKEYEDLLSRELESHGKDENICVNIDDHVEYKNEGSMVKANSSIENEYTVVTLLVLATGQYLIPNFKGTGARYHECLEQLQKRGDLGRCYDFFEVLRTLERIPKNELHSVEVLWSPRKEDKVLLEDELLRNFPRLVRIENGLIYGSVKA